MRPAGLYEATEAGILFVGSSVEGMSKHELRSEKPWSSDLRTGVRLSSAPPPKDSDIDTMSESLFLHSFD